MQLTYRTCGNCANWSNYKLLLDDVVAAPCEVTAVPNKQLGMSQKVTKGSDSCGKWKRK